MIITIQQLRLYCSIYIRIQYFISRVIFNINLSSNLANTFISNGNVTTFNAVISVFLVGYCFSALNCVDLMSTRSIRCGSNDLGRTSTDGVPRSLQLLLSCTPLVGNVFSFKDACQFKPISCDSGDLQKPYFYLHQDIKLYFQ